MSITKRDYILRMIEQFAAALARIVGMKDAGKLDEALRLIRETADGIFGPLGPMLEGIDSASAASLIGDREKMAIYAALIAEQAAIFDRQGQAARARTGYRRALELYLEAARLASPIEEKVVLAIESLRTKVDVGRLPDRYRSMLDPGRAGRQ